MGVRLLVVVQERTFADALATRLDTEQDVEVVAAMQVNHPSPQLCRGSGADVILLDADFPGGAALAVSEELCQSGAAPHVVLLSQVSEPDRIVRAIAAGAAGWVRQDESVDRLLEVIRGAARSETWLPPRQTGDVLRLLLREPDPEEDSGSRALATLTWREREVLRCIAEGRRRRDVAEHLHISPQTVRTHLQNLMVKLGVHSAVEAVALTRSHLGGQLPPGARDRNASRPI